MACIVFWTTYPPSNRMPTLKQKMDAIGHSSTGSIWLLEVFMWLIQCGCGGWGGVAERVCETLCVCVCVWEREREYVCVGRGRNQEICHYPLVYFAFLICLQKLMYKLCGWIFVNLSLALARFGEKKIASSLVPIHCLVVYQKTGAVLGPYDF